jgi:hypothetical protein
LQLNESEQWLLLDGLNHKIDKTLCLFLRIALSIDDQFVEVAIDNVATELLESVQKLEEVLLH